jgi:ketosteroid isomerase-like protein
MSTSIEAVRRAYEAFKNFDAEALIEVADPEIEFGTSAAAPGGTYRGHTGIRRYMKEVEGAFGDRWEAEIERVADAGDDTVILIARVFGEGKAGEPLELHVGHVWQLRDGKLLRGTVYLDPEAALAAVEAGASRG